MIAGVEDSHMLSDGMILALIILVLVGCGVGAVYAGRRLQRVKRVISDRERKWALIVIGLVTLTKIPVVVPVLPELMKLGVAATLGILPLLFIVNGYLAVAVWKRQLGLRGVVTIIVLQTLSQYSKAMGEQEREHVWGFSIAAQSRPCEAYVETSLAAATAGGWISDLDKSWHATGGTCVTRNHGKGAVVLCQDGKTFVVLGLAVGKSACSELETEVEAAAQRTKRTDPDALSTLLRRG